MIATTTGVALTMAHIERMAVERTMTITIGRAMIRGSTTIIGIESRPIRTFARPEEHAGVKVSDLLAGNIPEAWT